MRSQRRLETNKKIPAGFARARKRRLCPVCGKPDWCLVGLDDEGHVVSALCKRVQSPREWKDAGFFHSLDGSQRLPRMTKKEIKEGMRPYLTRPQCQFLSTRFHADLNAEDAIKLAESLGLDKSGVLDFSVGFATRRDAWTFPMVDDRGEVTGFRLRDKATGRKGSITGSREGLFVPKGLTQLLTEHRRVPLHFCEGPTSAWALWDMNKAPCGRPSCNSGNALALSYLGRLRNRDVVVWADRDEAKRADGTTFYPGRDGGEKFAAEVARSGYALSVKVIVPPGCKDPRDLKKIAERHGGSRYLDDIIRSARFFYRR